MIERLNVILFAIDEAIKIDNSGSAHLYVARSAIENQIAAIERSVTHIMGNNGEEVKKEVN